MAKAKATETAAPPASGGHERAAYSSAGDIQAIAAGLRGRDIKLTLEDVAALTEDDRVEIVDWLARQGAPPHPDCLKQFLEKPADQAAGPANNAADTSKTSSSNGKGSREIAPGSPAERKLQQKMLELARDAGELSRQVRDAEEEWMEAKADASDKKRRFEKLRERLEQIGLEMADVNAGQYQNKLFDPVVAAQSHPDLIGGTDRPVGTPALEAAAKAHKEKAASAAPDNLAATENPAAADPPAKKRGRKKAAEAAESGVARAGRSIDLLDIPEKWRTQLRDAGIPTIAALDDEIAAGWPTIARKFSATVKADIEKQRLNLPPDHGRKAPPPADDEPVPVVPDHDAAIEDDF